ncbi:hypothetical protein A3D03_02485 [Candidatus Gottesmanbacteria bacterium RIFCSPHIGHO2_02_FULL_40_13]|uniref:Membrane protein 6-pyruvoyl-tetrahydropterin synthase-related domain-containing protein n=1 Tax=Candidatus Gottesmanbacteria bacterium RIFCSPHIGHO2_02_FULL_40_13 TaxID=1798384 RepID=A0A1F6A9X5_9BACT|nr:MAG: hypothetical protein A3D03_02485 [Candidatus Gottesmanbacteria bacterium RIFCSPHIGHO2_02_FULL_40_13]
MSYLRNKFPLIIIFIFCILFTLPFYKTGYFTTHDGEWSVIRLSEMVREVKDLQFPPRWSDYLNHGYGYPLFTFTYPLPYYAGTFLKLINIGLVESVKILFVLSVFISAFFMYKLGSILRDKTSGLFAALYYLSANYRLVNLYIRGSLGESLAFIFFPLIFYMAIIYINNPSVWNYLLLSLSLAGLILSHNVMAILFIPFFMLFYFLYVLHQKRKLNLSAWIKMILPLLQGFGLAAYFFIPALLEKKYIYLSQIPLSAIADNFIKLKDLVYTPWNYGIKPPISLGIGHSLALLFILICYLIFNNKKYKKDFLFNFLIVSLLLLLYLTNINSSLFWKYPPLVWLDFPWRMMGIIIFIISLLMIYLPKRPILKSIFTFLTIVVLITNLNFVKPSTYINKPDSYYETNDATTTSMDELMPIWVKQKAKNRYISKIEFDDKISAVTNLTYNSKNIEFNATALSPVMIKINSLFFPGWKFQINGINTSISIQEPDGVMSLELNQGSHQIRGRFEETPLRLIADWVSILSAVFLVIVVRFNKSFFNRHEN